MKKNDKLTEPVFQELQKMDFSNWFHLKRPFESFPWESKARSLSPRLIGTYLLNHPEVAKAHFDESILAFFEYSCLALAAIRNPCLPPPGTPQFAAIVSAQADEARAWGDIFAAIITSAPAEHEPLIFKILCPEDQASHPYGRCWWDSTQNRPIVWKMKDLIRYKRNYITVSDEEGDEDFDWKFQSVPQVPNIGPVSDEDRGVIATLPVGWGFNQSGGVSFRSLNHDEYEEQTRLGSRTRAPSAA